MVGPLFEQAPRFLARLAAARPFTTAEMLFSHARQIALSMPADEQRELIDAHPRIGAAPATVSALSFREQGYDRDAAGNRTRSVTDRRPSLDRLNAAYERALRLSLRGLRGRAPAFGDHPGDGAPAATRREGGAEHRAERGRRHRRGSLAAFCAAERRRRREGRVPLRQGGGLDLPHVRRSTAGPDAHPGIRVHRPVQRAAGGLDRRAGHGRLLLCRLHPRRQHERRAHRHDEELHPPRVDGLRRAARSRAGSSSWVAASWRPTRGWSVCASPARSSPSRRPASREPRAGSFTDSGVLFHRRHGDRSIAAARDRPRGGRLGDAARPALGTRRPRADQGHRQRLRRLPARRLHHAPRAQGPAALHPPRRRVALRGPVRDDRSGPGGVRGPRAGGGPGGRTSSTSSSACRSSTSSTRWARACWSASRSWSRSRSRRRTGCGTRPRSRRRTSGSASTPILARRTAASG